MDKLPLEILQHIFILACVDGGFTGCSLSGTSRAVRSASRTARFHSVSLLAEPNHLRLFLSLYAEQTRPIHGYHARVRHIHLTCPLEPELLSPPDEPSKCAVSGVRALLRAVANDLHTLFLQVENVHSTGNPLPILVAPLPALRELTTVGIADPRALVDDALSPTPLFPAATRVHCVLSGPRGMPFNPSLAPWTMHAPRATHLRLTNVPSMAYLLAGELLAATDMTSAIIAGNALRSVDRGDDAGDVARLRAHLRYIVLQPVARYSGCGYVAKTLAACPPSTDGGPRIIFVEPGDDLLDAAAEWSRSMATAVREWTGRIEGSLGCWDCVANSEQTREGRTDRDVIED
ncbi:hypothetical protein C8Q78DRAFT_110426 [Trametes maxima]|nr:hypothetical protein C8Q78DRAFT_110426 [Trametes maxima]